MTDDPLFPNEEIKKLYALIGQICSGWAIFETRVHVIIWDVADVPQPLGACMTAYMGGIYAKFKAMKALFIARFGEQKHVVEQINAISADSVNLQEIRNRFIHDPIIWKEGIVDVSQWRTTVVKNKLEFGEKPLTEAELRKFVGSIRELLTRMHDLDRDVRKLIAASPDKWRQQFLRIQPPSETPDPYSDGATQQPQP